MKKRILSVLLVLCMLFSILPTAALADTSSEAGNPFTDVSSNRYYYDAVLWAVDYGVTAGTSATAFSPNAACTRGQVVTFLWRAAGEPEPTSDENPFTDVKSGKYYYKAVLWAVEEGITAGTTATTFSPNAACTRAQFVTFLWRFAGKSGPTLSGADTGFTDLPKTGSAYYKPILWAVEQGITKGTSNTTFEPGTTCNRAQVVTFLYRYLAEPQEGMTAQEYFEKYSEIVDTLDVEATDEVLSEAEANTVLDDRGFEDGNVEYDYMIDGEYVDYTEAEEDSSVKHPMYVTVYQAASGDEWAIWIVNDQVYANPVSFNLISDLGVQLLLSESEVITSYDDATDTFYETIPDESALHVQTVAQIDPETLDNYTIAELCSLTGATLTEDEGEDSAEVTEEALYSSAAAETTETANRSVSSADLSGDGKVVVVSLGDSYSSGEGNDPFYGQQDSSGNERSVTAKVTDYDWLAHRSTLSWGAMLKLPDVAGSMGEFKVAYGGTGTDAVQWYFAASSGAKTVHITDHGQNKSYRKKVGFLTYQAGTVTLPKQLSVFDDIQDDVDYVTLTIGGNDVDFTGVITKCVMESSYLHQAFWNWVASDTMSRSNNCWSQQTHLEQKLEELWENIDSTMADIKKVYTGIQSAAGGQAAIIVAGYPELLDYKGAGAVISQREAIAVNAKVRAFNDQIEALVKQCNSEGMNIYFVDVEGAFKTHQMYSSDAWLNSIQLTARLQDLDDMAKSSAYSCHPNYKGQVAYARCVNAKLEEIASNTAADPTPVDGVTYVTFGSYEQDNNTANGKEAIEWRVLATDGDYSLIISRYGLDAKAYNTSHTSVTWETCTLRSWLNGYGASSNVDGENYTSDNFINTAFTSEEQSAIRTTTVANPDTYEGYDSDGNYIQNNTGAGITDLRYHTSGAGGNTTYDKVFLLSLDEAQTYFDYTAQTLTETNGANHTGCPDLQTSPTAYAVAQGAWQSSLFTTAAGDVCCVWLLRSPGYGRYGTSFVYDYGWLGDTQIVTNDDLCVRPALWVKTSALAS